MFSDPLVVNTLWSTVTVDSAGNKSFAASSREANQSTYRYTDADLNDHVFKIGHQYGRRNRFTVRYDMSGYTPSISVPDQNQRFSQSCYCVIDTEPGGPIYGTASVTNLIRQQLRGVGGFLISAGAATVDPIVMRLVLNGET